MQIENAVLVKSIGFGDGYWRAPTRGTAPDPMEAHIYDRSDLPHHLQRGLESGAATLIPITEFPPEVMWAHLVKEQAEKEESASLAALLANDADRYSQIMALIDDIRDREPPAGKGLNDLADAIHYENLKWWTDLDTGERIERNKGEMFALMHSELSEALEGVRRGNADDHLPHLTSEAVELADLVIRVLDYCSGFNINIEQAIREKRAYNRTRQDHTIEARRLENGKKF